MATKPVVAHYCNTEVAEGKFEIRRSKSETNSNVDKWDDRDARVIPRLAKRAEGPHTSSSASAIRPACSAIQTWCAMCDSNRSGRSLAVSAARDDTFVLARRSMSNLLVATSLFSQQQPQKLSVRKSLKWPVSHDHESHRRDHVKSLITWAYTSDKIARCVAAKAGITPVLPLPFRHQHVFEIELPSAGRGPVIPPAKREGAISW